MQVEVPEKGLDYWNRTQHIGHKLGDPAPPHGPNLETEANTGKALWPSHSPSILNIKACHPILVRPPKEIPKKKHNMGPLINSGHIWLRLVLYLIVAF